MIYFPLVEIFGQRRLWGFLAYDSQEQCAPANHDLLVAEGCGEIELWSGQLLVICYASENLT